MLAVDSLNMDFRATLLFIVALDFRPGSWKLEKLDLELISRLLPWVNALGLYELVMFLSSGQA